jgi:hypothetical protein
MGIGEQGKPAEGPGLHQGEIQVIAGGGGDLLSFLLHQQSQAQVVERAHGHAEAAPGYGGSQELRTTQKLSCAGLRTFHPIATRVLLCYLNRSLRLTFACSSKTKHLLPAMNVLKKSLTTVALAGSISALTSFVSAPAHAALCGTATFSELSASAPPFEITCGDKKFFDFTSISFGSTTGIVEFIDSGSLHELVFKFDTPGLGLGTFGLNYYAEVTSGEDIIGLNTMNVATGNPVNVTSTLESIPVPGSFPGGFGTYALNSSIVVDGTDPSVTEWRHMITQTPGPLPILGAGAAFGFSRKLRKRIKQSA